MIRRGIGVQSYVSAGGAAPVDADAQAFITAAGITDGTQRSAINTLVTDLKSYGIWTKMKAIYPFVGGTSSTHKWNLKDPRDLDAAFRLVFTGGGTHASTGWTPNGVNGYGDTKFKMTSNGNINSTHLSFYSRTNINTTQVDMGSFTEGVGSYVIAAYNSLSYYRVNTNAGICPDIAFSNTNSLGFFNANRKANNILDGWINSNKVGTSSCTALTGDSNNVFIGAWNLNGSATNYSSKECAFASIGDGLTDTEAANLYTAVQAYQTTLSRNV